MKEHSMFFSWCFMASDLTFMSLIHFKMIFVCDKRKWSSLILLHIAIEFFQHHLLKRLYFPQRLHSCLLYCRIIGNVSISLFLSSLFHSIDLCGVFWFWFGLVWFCLYHTVLITVALKYIWNQGTWYL